MGYDDNRPLTGVTGGSLPADIWRETMTRVLTDQQPTPLLMQAPGNATSNTVLGGGTTDEVADRVLMDVLNGILNGN
jgi:membrane peptidoglycan carboxypeptidase